MGRKEKEKIKAITSIYKELNIKEITQAKIDFYFEAAAKNLKDLKLTKEQKDQLRELSKILLNRNN